MDPHSYSAKQVGDEFARQYYQTLQNSPENLYTFYKDNSTISRPGLDGTMRVFTLSDVDENDLKMQSSDGFDSVVITSVTSQDSHEQGFLVAVYGCLTFNERPAKHFTQSVFLAPQEDGYFVLTDIFKFVDIPEVNAAIPPANDVTEEKVPETEEAALRVSEPSQGFENVPKLSHASVVSGHSNHQHSSSCGYSPEIKPRNGNSQESRAVSEACIYLHWLPTKTTVALVENAFKQFGKIRRGGVELRSKKRYKGKYAYVEFEEAEAANRAIMASPLSIFGYRITVQKNRSYLKGYCESPSAGPGNIHRGEGVRGSLGNPFYNWQKMMEEVRETDVWQKLMMGSRGTEVYDLHNWQKIMDQSEEQMKFQEEQGRQYNHNRYTSEEVRGTEEFGLEEEEEEENQNWETLTEEQRKIQEEEGRQYNQNRYTRDQMKETGGAGQIPEEEEEEDDQN
ncbi:unnamed protein product [Arabidopsis lyrata]|nr:unnamed protein product [Arabidopsis lyrata]